MEENTRESEPEAGMEMPKYQCHKQVHALKIKQVELVPLGPHMIHPEEDGFAPFGVDDTYIKKHNPQAGGYFVVYEDGYTSYSPAAAFENGYTRID